MKRLTVAAVIGLFVLGMASMAAAELVELKPVVQEAINPFVQFEEPFGVLEDMIAYDGGPTYYYPQAIEVGRMWSVRFTPAQPCSLKALSIVSYPTGGNADIHAWDDYNGSPGDDLFTPFTTYMWGNTNYQRINIDPAINIGEVDFHGGWEYTSTPPPYATSDALPPVENRSKSYNPTTHAWQIWSHNLNIRAYVQYYGEDNTPPAITHIPISMGFTDDTTVVLATIIDDSGVDNAYVYYDDGSGWESLVLEHTVGNFYEATLPMFEAGTEISYYIEATDASPNSNTGYFPPGGQSDPLVYDVVEGSEIAYDDGQQEGWWVASHTWDSNAFAVRCTPRDYPAKITMLRAYVNGVDGFKFSVNNYTAGQPGALIAGPWNASASSSPGWVNFELPSQIDINSGDFCVVFHWNEATPDQPAVGGDATMPDGRSFWRSGASWNSSPTDDFMLRAVVLYTVVGIEDELGGSLPSEFALDQNYPNPFNATTNISYSIDETADVDLSIYNLAGQKVATLVDGVMDAGAYSVNWNAGNFSSGVYFYKLTAGEKVMTRKMNLLK